MKRCIILLGVVSAAGVLFGPLRLVHAGPSAGSPTGIDWSAPAAANPVTATSSIRWEKSFAAARVRAKAERKPILLLHLFGRLDEEFC